MEMTKFQSLLRASKTNPADNAGKKLSLTRMERLEVGTTS